MTGRTNAASVFTDDVENGFALICVSYTSGYMCTCTKGDITLTATDTSGAYTFYVPAAGLWTVSINDNNVSPVGVDVVYAGQVDRVHVGSQYTYLYSGGNTFADITGGWNATGWTASVSVVSGVLKDTYIQMYGTNSKSTVISTAEKIDVTDYTELHLVANVLSTYPNEPAIYFALSTARSDTSAYRVKNVEAERYGYENADIVIDVSDLTGSYYVYAHASGVIDYKSHIKQVYAIKGASA